MGASFLFALTVGVVSTVNPCGFALLPAYFARRLGLEVGTGQNMIQSLSLALLSGAVTTAGVVLAFMSLGLAFSFGVVSL